MKNIVLFGGIALGAIAGIVFFLPRRPKEVKLMAEKIEKLQERFKGLDAA